MTSDHDRGHEPLSPKSDSLRLFQAARDFALDRFQVDACRELDQGRSVLVAAPTGAGKTVVAEYAIHTAMRSTHQKVFYTAPMKALSNQKYAELVAQYGQGAVGLLTGDTTINTHARIVVMTTEVLRNMLYAGSDLLPGLATVVLDEVHYLADRFRGAVWEEVIIHLPASVTLVALSATVSNAEEFGDWLETVRGRTTTIVSEERPVPLDQHVIIDGEMLPLFQSGHGPSTRVNQDLVRRTQQGRRPPARARRQRGRGRLPRRPAFRRARRDDTVRMLQSRHLLPAIVFIFSRAGCDQAVEQILRSGVELSDRSQRARVRRYVEERCADIPDADRAVLGYRGWLDGLERGVAAHHAGMIPVFKEIVEELFRQRLLHVVFATETLALGINMPARTVVLERLEKFNGESRVRITPGEYTQLTGRAGRRGIDVEGHAVVPWDGSIKPHELAALASKRSYPLRSSFRPSYNMAVNLVSQFGRERTRSILQSSFAQFQADRSVLSLAQKVTKQEESLAGYRSAMECDRGDFFDYSTLRQELTQAERRPRRHGSEHDEHARQQRIDELRSRLRRHPCHSCPEREQHARWAERWWKLRHSTDDLRREISSRTSAVAAVFDRVSSVLITLGYVSSDGDEPTLTDAGRILARVYGDRDLLAAECIRFGVWDDLDAPSLAAMVAMLVFEPRRDSFEYGDDALPDERLRAALTVVRSFWARLDDLETDQRLSRSDPPSTALAPAMYMWARGDGLRAVLVEANMAAGDFVRWCRQTTDLLDQVAFVAPAGLAETAREALDGINRGLVAYASV